MPGGAGPEVVMTNGRKKKRAGQSIIVFYGIRATADYANSAPP